MYALQMGKLRCKGFGLTGKPVAELKLEHFPASGSLAPTPQAAARHQCSYLVGSHMTEFLQTGGDPEWLLGLHRAPEKLRKLSEINKLLAHRPWLITKEHIQV